ncbi:ATP-binding protein [Phormidium sp. FACHB-592]|uniref:ATP-binding protein n=1 Tax=Stenomitos frigidus AS-A4 TaxID=2933935 RepID=A0ABV0KTM2_9CYAN|nr:ATP-binding protein [Phormidium sp. FACHB-592]MBD2076818.1 ATP-binding protein [Phormidium sp. FACHB-592]
MLSERVPLGYPIQTVPDSPTVEAQIRALIEREFLAETSYFSGLEDWLKQRNRDKLCGRIIGSDRSGKSVAAKHWVDEISGRRGDLLPIPLRIHIIDLESSCSTRKLCNLISGSLGRGAKGGKPKDFTFRAWDTLKLFRVDALLIDHAHFLTENALSTLIAMSRRSEYRIPAILIGSTDLDAWLKKAGKFDYFKPFYRFKNLSSEEFAGVIKAFERQFLELPASVDLIDVDSVEVLYGVTKGNIEDFVEILIQVIQLSSSNEALSFDPQVLSQVLESYGDGYFDEEEV